MAGGEARAGPQRWPSLWRCWEEVRDLSAVCGVALCGRVLGDVRFACGEAGSVMMSLGCAMDAI